VPMCALRFSADAGAMRGRSRRQKPTMRCWRSGRRPRALPRLEGELVWPGPGMRVRAKKAMRRMVMVMQLTVVLTTVTERTQ
jgi:hypothetical protein